MSIKAILATLILGGSSATALAGDDVYGAPYAPYADPYVGNDFDRYERDGDFYGGHGEQRAWLRPILLAQNVPLLGDGGGYRERPTFVRLDPRQGHVRTLRFERASGRAYVSSITVMFADGHRQVIHVNQLLSRRRPAALVQLPHAGVVGILVHGAPASRSSYGHRGHGSYGGYGGYGGATINIVGLRS